MFSSRHIFSGNTGYIIFFSIMSKLLRKLRQIEYYPKSGDVLSVLVDQISYDSLDFMSNKNDSIGFILVSAFEEIVKLIDVSCGTHVEFYVPTVLTLSKILPMTSSKKISSKFLKNKRIASFKDLLEKRRNQDDDRMHEEETERHGFRIFRPSTEKCFIIEFSVNRKFSGNRIPKKLRKQSYKCYR